MFEEGKYLLSKRENKGEGKEGKRYKKEKYLVHGGKGRGGEYLVCRAEEQQIMKRRKNLSEKENVLRATWLPCGPKVV